jgi:hypothetical protein
MWRPTVGKANKPPQVSRADSGSIALCYLTQPVGCRRRRLLGQERPYLTQLRGCSHHKPNMVVCSGWPSNDSFRRCLPMKRQLAQEPTRNA